MASITSTINAHVYIEILDNFLIPSIENCFFEDEVNFQDDNAYCYRVKMINCFLQKRHRKSIKLPENSPDLNPIENL